MDHRAAANQSCLITTLGISGSEPLFTSFLSHLPSGRAFWEDRHHAAAVDSDQYLARCMVYIDLNMVRAGVVDHPADKDFLERMEPAEKKFGSVASRITGFARVVRRLPLAPKGNGLQFNVLLKRYGASGITRQAVPDRQCAPPYVAAAAA